MLWLPKRTVSVKEFFKTPKITQDQEPIQSSIKPDTGHHNGKVKKTHKKTSYTSDHQKHMFRLMNKKISCTLDNDI